MAESTRLVDLVQAEIDGFLDRRQPTLSSIAPELAPLLSFSRDLLRGGKRFRALFCYWGWQAATGRRAGFDPLGPDGPGADESPDLSPIISAASALEIFHAAALVHDDIMDNSDTRRGMPAAHKRFQALHVDAEWHGDADAFGRSSALLLGDLLLGWSDELFDEAAARLGGSPAAVAARAEFIRMRTEVTVGQYLDVLEESAWVRFDDAEQLPRAHRVIVYKSAKYSVEEPLVIGAALAGASADQIEALRAFGLPLGIAYQLRDDLLGVFGDPAVTGKPAGDDLREGKRTVLIALARAALPVSARTTLDELLGDPELDDRQVRMLQTSIRDCGAVEKVEHLISHSVERAQQALSDAPLSAASRDQLAQLAETVTRRSA